MGKINKMIALLVIVALAACSVSAEVNAWMVPRSNIYLRDRTKPLATFNGPWQNFRLNNCVGGPGAPCAVDSLAETSAQAWKMQLYIHCFAVGTLDPVIINLLKSQYESEPGNSPITVAWQDLEACVNKHLVNVQFHHVQGLTAEFGATLAIDPASGVHTQIAAQGNGQLWADAGVGTFDEEVHSVEPKSLTFGGGPMRVYVENIEALNQFVGGGHERKLLEAEDVAADERKSPDRGEMAEFREDGGETKSEVSDGDLVPADGGGHWVWRCADVACRASISGTAPGECIFSTVLQAAGLAASTLCDGDHASDITGMDCDPQFLISSAFVVCVSAVQQWIGGVF